MSHEQNISDILRSLKADVDRMPVDVEREVVFDPEIADISDEMLKSRLKAQFQTKDTVSTLDSSEDYALDETLLEEFSEFEEESDEEPEDILADEEDPCEENFAGEDFEGKKHDLSERLVEDSLDEPWGGDVFVEEKASDETENDDESFSELILEDSLDYEEDLAPWEVPGVSESSNEEFTELYGEESIEDLSTEGSIDRALETLLQEFEEDPLDESPVESKQELSDEDDTFEYQELPEIKTIELTDVVKDYSSDEIEESEWNSGEERNLLEETEEGSARVSEVVFDLMLQLGCEDELENVSEDEHADDVLREALEAEEDRARSAIRISEIRRKFKKNILFAVLRMIGMAFLTVLLFFYDFLPLLEVDFPGIIDYQTYPGAYTLIGMQLMLFGAVCLWRPVLEGFRRLFTFRPNLYSVAVLLVSVTVGYDLTMVIVLPTEIAPMFHFLTAVYMLGISIAELLGLLRDQKIFSIYACDEKRYTLVKELGKHSAAEKMYNGGLSAEQSVLTPAAAEFPKDFENVIRDPNAMGNRMITGIMFPSALLAILAAVVCMLRGETVESSFAIAMAMLFATLPLSLITTVCIPSWISACRLKQRGIALTGKPMIERYAKTDHIVFKDLHLFEKCRSEDTGIVFYDESQTSDVLGCLQILYSRIGGPVSDVFEHLPDELRFSELRVYRIARSGIEAFVDRAHILLVGDEEFMKRYGLIFPQSEAGEGRANLCVSLDGKVSARVSLRYRTLPVFEMLIERLSENGIGTVIETYDPMVHTAFVASCRTLGQSPVSVIHKNKSDWMAEEKSNTHVKKDSGIMVLGSRLKLAEAVIWCKRLIRIRHIQHTVTGVFSLIGATIVALFLFLGGASVLNQYLMLLFSAFPCLIVFFISFLGFPGKNYCTVEKLRQELESRKKKI